MIDTNKDNEIITDAQILDSITDLYNDTTNARALTDIATNILYDLENISNVREHEQLIALNDAVINNINEINNKLECLEKSLLNRTQTD